jgi:hypothetical protein
MIVRCNFNLNAFIQQLELDLAPGEDAYEELMKLTLADIAAGCPFPDLKLDDIDIDVISRDYIVKVSNITYNNLVGPTELTFNFYDIENEDDIDEELVRDEILFVTGHHAVSFDIDSIKEHRMYS